MFPDFIFLSTHNFVGGVVVPVVFLLIVFALLMTTIRNITIFPIGLVLMFVASMMTGIYQTQYNDQFKQCRVIQTSFQQVEGEMWQCATRTNRNQPFGEYQNRAFRSNQFEVSFR